MVFRIAAGRDLFTEPEQAEMAALMRTEAAHFDVVARRLMTAMTDENLVEAEEFLAIIEQRLDHGAALQRHVAMRRRAQQAPHPVRRPCR